MKNKYIILGGLSIILALALFCFLNKIHFDKDYYERISGIKFPDKYKIIETRDNGEFVTIVSMHVAAADLQMMIKNNKFDTLKPQQPIHFFGLGLLKKIKPDLEPLANKFVFQKKNGKNDCTYLIDLNKNILWAEISYPDWGGN